jgi:hypothetical protein
MNSRQLWSHLLKKMRNFNFVLFHWNPFKFFDWNGKAFFLSLQTFQNLCHKDRPSLHHLSKRAANKKALGATFFLPVPVAGLKPAIIGLWVECSTTVPPGHSQQLRKFKNLLNTVMIFFNMLSSVSATLMQSKRFHSWMRWNKIKFGRDQKVEFKFF